MGRVRLYAQRAIGVYRRSAAVRSVHKLASFVESAYANEGSSFQWNGEQALLRKLKSADFRIALDVGANFGDWSSEAIALWPNCHVHAFEVAPQTFQVLSKRLGDSENRHRFTLNCVGLSDTPGVRQMYYYPEHPELTSDLHHHEDHQVVPFDAQLSTGDEYCDRHSIDSVDFLKIDVEGAEFLVMKGFSGRLSAQKIHCLQFEYGAFSTQTKFLLGDYYSLLSQSYWIGKIFPTYVEFRDYDWTMEDFRFSNYCCLSKLRPDLRTILAA